MHRLALAVVLVLVSVSPAWAWTAIYSWLPTSGATGYKVERSTDNGATWVVVGSPTTPGFTYTGTETGLTIFRFSSCTAQGCFPRMGDGVWHNEAWAPLQTMNIGVQ